MMLDGRLVGYVAKREAAVLVDKLRVLKIRRDDARVPATTEIVLVPYRHDLIHMYLVIYSDI